MKQLYILVLSALGLLLMAGGPASKSIAHGGGLNAQGCHNNRKTGDYHCHRGGSPGGSLFKGSKVQSS